MRCFSVVHFEHFGLERTIISRFGPFISSKQWTWATHQCVAILVLESAFIIHCFLMPVW